MTLLRYCCYLHFVDKEIEDLGVKNLQVVARLIREGP